MKYCPKCGGRLSSGCAVCPLCKYKLPHKYALKPFEDTHAGQPSPYHQTDGYMTQDEPYIFHAPKSERRIRKRRLVAAYKAAKISLSLCCIALCFLPVYYTGNGSCGFIELYRSALHGFDDSTGIPALCFTGGVLTVFAVMLHAAHIIITGSTENGAPVLGTVTGAAGLVSCIFWLAAMPALNEGYGLGGISPHPCLWLLLAATVLLTAGSGILYKLIKNKSTAG